MKRKFGMLLFSCLFAVLLTSCDELLSIVTAGENGEKIVKNYVSVISDKVYDETASFSSWKDTEILTDEDEVVKMDALLFKIENKKEQLVVLGDKDSAVELSFFDGGYKFTVFASMDNFDNMFE